MRTRRVAPVSVLHNRTLQGCLLALLAVFSLSLMDALVKYIGAAIPVPQIVFLRTWVVMVCVLIASACTGRRVTLVTTRPGAHLFRGLMGLLAFLCFFTAVTQIPLAQAVAILFAAPLFIATLSALWLKERVGPRRWFGVLLGFAGVLIIVRPLGQDFTSGSLLALCAALAYALMMVQTRRMADTESAGSMVLWQALVACLGSGLLMPFLWQLPSAAELLLVAAVGVLSAVGHYGLSAAYSRAEASLLAPLDYTAMIWAVSFGYLFWGELPDRYTVAGCAVVIAAGLYVLYRERRAAALA